MFFFLAKAPGTTAREQILRRYPGPGGDAPAPHPTKEQDARGMRSEHPLPPCLFRFWRFIVHPHPPSHPTPQQKIPLIFTKRHENAPVCAAVNLEATQRLQLMQLFEFFCNIHRFFHLLGSTRCCPISASNLLRVWSKTHFIFCRQKAFIF